jgi:hypothetical protein
MVKAILIDAYNKKIVETEAGGDDISYIYEQLKCSTFQGIEIGELTVFIDEEGRINGTKRGFSIQGWHEPVVLGSGLVVEYGEDGELVDVPVTVEDVERMVTFIDYDNEHDIPQPAPFVVSFGS